MSNLPTNSQIKIGMTVLIESKYDQGTGKLTEGIVAEKLTTGEFHSYGIMVRLDDGIKGRVKEIFVKSLNDSKHEWMLQKFDTQKFQEYADEISNYRRHTTPQFEIEPPQVATKIILKSNVPKSEDKFNEFKKTFQIDSKEKEFRLAGNTAVADGRKKEQKKIEHDIKKEISIAVSAFGNTIGGKLFIGVDDGGNVVGLDDDLKSYDDSFDKFTREVQKSIDDFTKDSVFANEIIISIGEDNSFLQLEVLPFRQNPIYVHDKELEEFYIRGFGTSKKLTTKHAVNYIKKNF
jgi:uncharacterized repeat protein (TIGR03833 family)